MLFSQSWIGMAMAIWLLMIVLTVAVLTLVVRALRHMNREPSLTAITPAQGEFLNAGPVRAARRRMLAAVAAGVVVLVVGLAVNDAISPLYRIASVTPGLAASAVMLVLALPFPESSVGIGGGGVRVASLRSREPWAYARRYVLIQPVLAAVLLIAYLCFTMATASPDDSGLMRSISLTYGRDGELTGSAGPYPGSYYSVPLIAVTVLLLALTCCALWRIAHTPSVPDERYAHADRLWRVALTRFTVFLSVGSMLAYAVAVLLVAGSAVVRVGTNGGTWPASYADDVCPTLGWAQIVVGDVLAIAALAFLVMAVMSAVRLWMAPKRLETFGGRS